MKREYLYAPAGPFAEAIRVFERRLPLEELAARSNMGSRDLRRIRDGESIIIELDRADRLAIALGIPLPLLADQFMRRTQAQRMAVNA